MASFTFNAPQTTTANTGGFAFGGLNTTAIGTPAQPTQAQAAPGKRKKIFDSHKQFE